MPDLLEPEEILSDKSLKLQVLKFSVQFPGNIGENESKKKGSFVSPATEL